MATPLRMVSQPGLARDATTKAAGEASGGGNEGIVDGEDVRAEQRLRRLRWRLQNGTKGANSAARQQSPSADKEVGPVEALPRPHARAPYSRVRARQRDGRGQCAVHIGSTWLTARDAPLRARTRPTAWCARLLTIRGRPSRAARRVCSAGLSLRRYVWSLRRRCACARRQGCQTQP